jgi:type I restriction enzyme S subunit
MAHELTLDSSWRVVQLRSIARVVPGYPFDSARFGDSGFPVIRIRDLNKAWTTTRYSGTFVAQAAVTREDVLIGMDGSFNVGRWLSDEPALLNQRMCCVRTKDPDLRRFLAYALVQPLADINAVTWATTVKHLSMKQIRRIQLPVPAGDELATAVRYLDNVELALGRARIAKRRLVELLAERKRTHSESLVTRGTQEAGELRFSGIEWLGDVPAHWEQRPAKWFYREVNERSARGDEQLVSVSHLTGVTPRSTKNVTMFMAASYAGHKLCRPGDLVINTMWAWMGALGVATGSGIVSPAYGVYRPHPDSPLLPEYADLLLRTRPYIDEYTCRSTGIRSSRLRLYPDRFLTIPIICPPVAEQQEIVARVSDATRDLDAAVAATLREIELLEEYRTRLMVDVVTGRRDIRAEAATLPDVDPKELDAVLSAASADDDVEEYDGE